MTRRHFDDLRVGHHVVFIDSGVETQVTAIDESDLTFADSTGAWHSYEDAELPEYGA